MKRISIFVSVIILVGIMIFLVSCAKSTESKFVGTWQDINDANTSFTVSKSESGLLLQASGESDTIVVTIQGDNLIVDGTTFILDEQKSELSTNGLFDNKISFKKVTGEQK